MKVWAIPCLRNRHIAEHVVCRQINPKDKEFAAELGRIVARALNNAVEAGYKATEITVKVRFEV